MSSRNVRLNQSEREVAPKIFESLQLVAQNWTITNWELGLNQAQVNLQKPPFQFEYLCACDPITLDSLRHFQSNAIILVAVQLGSTRLIDNILVGS
jgi:pantoate--beta-alanine ligase